MWFEVTIQSCSGARVLLIISCTCCSYFLHPLSNFIQLVSVFFICSTLYLFWGGRGVVMSNFTPFLLSSGQIILHQLYSCLQFYTQYCLLHTRYQDGFYETVLYIIQQPWDISHLKETVNQMPLLTAWAKYRPGPWITWRTALVYARTQLKSCQNVKHLPVQ